MALAGCAEAPPLVPELFTRCRVAGVFTNTLSSLSRAEEASKGSSTKVLFLGAGYAMEQKSSIIAIGLSVHHTPVDIREKLSIPEVRGRDRGAAAP